MVDPAQTLTAWKIAEGASSERDLRFKVERRGGANLQGMDRLPSLSSAGRPSHLVRPRVDCRSFDVEDTIVMFDRDDETMPDADSSSRQDEKASSDEEFDPDYSLSLPGTASEKPKEAVDLRFKNLSEPRRCLIFLLGETMQRLIDDCFMGDLVGGLKDFFGVSKSSDLYRTITRMLRIIPFVRRYTKPNESNRPQFCFQLLADKYEEYQKANQDMSSVRCAEIVSRHFNKNVTPSMPTLEDSEAAKKLPAPTTRRRPRTGEVDGCESTKRSTPTKDQRVDNDDGEEIREKEREIQELRGEIADVEQRLVAYEKLPLQNLKFDASSGCLEISMSATRVRQLIGTSETARVAMTVASGPPIVGARLLENTAPRAEWKADWSADKRQVKLNVAQNDIDDLLDRTF